MQTASIEELNRKGHVVPDPLRVGRRVKIRFVTDFLGGSAFGYLHAPGVSTTIPDTDGGR